VGGDEDIGVKLEAARTSGAQRFVGPFGALGFGSGLALDARELARRRSGALHEKCDIFQAGACTGGAPSVEDALHPLLDRQDEGLDVVVGRRWQAVKAHGLARCPVLSLALRLLASRVGRFTEDSLGHERMGVRVKTRTVREALNLQDTACLGPVDAGGARHCALPARDLVSEHAEHQAGELGIEGNHARELARERQHKLSVRCLGEDAIDQMGGLLVHAPARTGRAQPALTGERDNPRPTTAGAFEAYEAMAEIATRDNGAELTFDEAWQTPGRVVAVGSCEEGVEVVTQERNERRITGVARMVGAGELRRRGDWDRGFGFRGLEQRHGAQQAHMSCQRSV